MQSFVQVLNKSNWGLPMNCNVKINEKVAEAKDWIEGIPVRVVRGYKMKKHAKVYAPE